MCHLWAGFNAFYKSYFEQSYSGFESLFRRHRHGIGIDWYVDRVKKRVLDPRTKTRRKDTKIWIISVPIQVT